MRRLLRPDVFADAVEAVEETLEAMWDALPGDPELRAWHFMLRHRHRFHTGSTAFAQAFGSWPALPAVDRRVLQAVFAEPRATLGGRRAHRSLLCSRFPALASLPVDRNSWDDTPLLPSPRHRFKAWALAHARLARRLNRAWSRRHGDPRRYYRLLDINGEGWRKMRARAEKHREAAHAFLDPTTLRELLPAPEERIEAHNPVAGTNEAKTLAGLLLFVGEYLDV